MRFYFEKQLKNKVTIDEMFTLINLIKQKWNFKIKDLSKDVGRKIIITFQNEIKITIKNICSEEYLIVETNSKDNLDKLWDFFETLN